MVIDDTVWFCFYNLLLQSVTPVALLRGSIWGRLPHELGWTRERQVGCLGPCWEGLYAVFGSRWASTHPCFRTARNCGLSQQLVVACWHHCIIAEHLLSSARHAYVPGTGGQACYCLQHPLHGTVSRRVSHSKEWGDTHPRGGNTWTTPLHHPTKGKWCRLYDFIKIWQRLKNVIFLTKKKNEIPIFYKSFLHFCLLEYFWNIMAEKLLLGASLESRRSIKQSMGAVKDSTRVTTIVFVALLIDLLGFTLILPLLPSILDHYSKNDVRAQWHSFEAFVFDMYSTM